MSIINKENIISYIEDEGLTPYKLSPQHDPYHVLINSPFLVGDKKFKCSILFETGAVRDYKGGDIMSWYEFVRRTKDLNSVNDAKFYFIKNYTNNIYLGDLLNKETKEEKEIKELSFEDLYVQFDKDEHKDYYKYLQSRKIDDFKINKLNLFIDEKQKRIVFPLYENNKLVFYSTRSIVKSPIPWIHCNAPSSKVIYKWDERQVIWITEGIFDALSISGGIALLGKHLSNHKLKKILSLMPDKIIVCMDADIYGLEAQILIANQICQYHSNVYIFNWNTYSKNGEKADLNSLDEIDENNIYKWDTKGRIMWKLLNLKKFPVDKTLPIYREKIKKII